VGAQILKFPPKIRTVVLFKAGEIPKTRQLLHN